MNAASSPSAVSWNGNLAMVGIPDTRATNSALGGTLNRFPEHFLRGFTHEPGVSREKSATAQREDERTVRLRFLRGRILQMFVGETCSRPVSSAETSDMSASCSLVKSLTVQSKGGVTGVTAVVLNSLKFYPQVVKLKAPSLAIERVKYVTLDLNCLILFRFLKLRHACDHEGSMKTSCMQLRVSQEFSPLLYWMLKIIEQSNDKSTKHIYLYMQDLEVEFDI